jgi:hypothetical protein
MPARDNLAQHELGLDRQLRVGTMVTFPSTDVLILGMFMLRLPFVAIHRFAKAHLSTSGR